MNFLVPCTFCEQPVSIGTLEATNLGSDTAQAECQNPGCHAVFKLELTARARPESARTGTAPDEAN